MNKKVVLAGDITYNMDLMKSNKETKGCLYRSSSHYICSVMMPDLPVDAKNSTLFTEAWDVSGKKALATFMKMKKRF